MVQIVNGNKIADQILKRLRTEVKKLKSKKIKPKLGVILVGNNKASEIYVSKKSQSAEKILMDFALYHYSTKISQA
ncbi:unnamed protein product, partial [marine sediment metagenome]